MSVNLPVPSHLTRRVLVRLAAAIALLAAVLFLPAGTLRFWEAWVYLAVLLTPISLTMAYFLKHDPELVERRMRTREKEARQRLIMRLGWIYFLAAFTLPGFDRRYGWSSVPAVVVVGADVVVLLAYGLFVLVLKENSYASRIIEVEPQQRVITTGPYAFVRHPMYAAALLMYIFSPLALGSYWAMIPSILLLWLLVARIRNEESVLLRELQGYREYTQKTRYRLVPHVW
jgi:protein-S-isoprenylcysteine O-methyltransferase Ste14